MSKYKSLCDWNRGQIEKNMSEILELVNHPKYVCRKCARAAEYDDVLCKPVKIKKIRKN
jgi:hypothetical protein